MTTPSSTKSDDEDIVIDRILPMWEEDMPFEKDLGEDLKVKTPKLHSKYMTLWFKTRRKKLLLSEELEEVEAEKFMYYSGKIANEKGHYFQEKLTKGEIDMYLKTEMRVLSLRKRVARSKEAEEALKEILNQINDRHRRIKTMGEHERFKVGSY